MAWQKGQSGNPKGKGRDKLFYDAIMLEAKSAEDLRGFRVIARKLLDLAVSGDIQAIKEVGNRIDGQPVAAIEATVEHGFVARVPGVADSTEEWLRQVTGKTTAAHLIQ